MPYLINDIVKQNDKNKFFIIDEIILKPEGEKPSYILHPIGEDLLPITEQAFECGEGAMFLAYTKMGNWTLENLKDHLIVNPKSKTIFEAPKKEKHIKIVFNPKNNTSRRQIILENVETMCMTDVHHTQTAEYIRTVFDIWFADKSHIELDEKDWKIALLESVEK